MVFTDFLAMGNVVGLVDCARVVACLAMARSDPQCRLCVPTWQVSTLHANLKNALPFRLVIAFRAVRLGAPSNGWAPLVDSTRIRLLQDLIRASRILLFGALHRT